MTRKRILGEEIALLRKTLKMSEAEFANRIGLEDRRELKLYESGKLKPKLPMKRALFKLLDQNAGKYVALKRLKQRIDERTQMDLQ